MTSKKIPQIIIAVDGYSSCGKSTFAKSIGSLLGYLYIDSGAMYRAVTLAAIRGGAITAEGIDEVKLHQILSSIHVGFVKDEAGSGWLTTLNGEVVEQEIRTLEVSQQVSPVAAIEAVREKLTEQQQNLGKSKGIVMDGRDIGTVVFPHAELKIFMTAQPRVRAMRRLKEMQEKGQSATIEEVMENIEQRDFIDKTREIAPLTQAEDAIVLDNSHLTVDEQMKWFEELFAEVTSKL